MENDELIKYEDEKDLNSEPTTPAQTEMEEASPVEPEFETGFEKTPMLIDESKGSELPEPKKMPAWLRKGLIYLISGLVLFLIGFLVSFYTSTVPFQNSYQSVLTELNKKDADLNNLQSQYAQTRIDLQNTQNNLVKAHLDLQDLEQDHEKLLAFSKFNQNLINFKYEIGLARFALLNKDTLSARQAISLAREYLETIRNLLDPDISTTIHDRLQDIHRLVLTDPEEALDELRTLSENLERIPLK